jgi:hypothetical protein
LIILFTLCTYNIKNETPKKLYTIYTETTFNIFDYLGLIARLCKPLGRGGWHGCVHSSENIKQLI